MKMLSHFFRLSIIFFILVSIQACVKTVPEISPPDNGGTPVVTPVGEPLGSAVTKTIGAGGGSITSEDGNVELIFPAGAVTGNTDISIQSVTNTDLVTISDITNFAPRADPSQIVYPDDASYYVPDPVGEINVISAKGVVAPYLISDPSEGRLLALSFTHSGTHDPKTHYTTKEGYSDYSGGDPNNGYPTSWGFQIFVNGDADIATDAMIVGALAKVVDVKLTLIKN